MKTLIVEDDYISSHILQEFLAIFGECDIIDNGKMAIELFIKSMESQNYYDAIFLDILLPETDGQEVLLYFREIEREYGIKGLDCAKIIMTSSFNDFDNINKAFANQADAFLIKPIERNKVLTELKKLDLIE